MMFLRTLVLITLCLNVQAQGNLVPNNQFEDNFACPGNDCNSYAISSCMPNWGSPGVGSPDYYHFCTPNNWMLPTHNVFGNQIPFSGNAFVGMYCFTPNEPQGREYIHVRLSEPLFAGVRYVVSFHVSLADMSRYAISSLGAHLSHQPLTQSEYWVIDVVPQIQNPAGNIIADTSGWVLVTDTFVSRTGGGEEWLTIGNFNYAAQSDTFAFQPPNPDMGGFYHSYYYIDDVSVIALDSVPDGIAERGALVFEVWPNPAQEVLRFSLRGSTWRPGGLGVRVMDAVGREVIASSSPPGKHVLSSVEGEGSGKVDISPLPKGIYLLELTDTEGKRAVRRFVKQ